MTSRAKGRLALALWTAATAWMLSGAQALAQPNGDAAPQAAPDDDVGPEAGTVRPAGPDERTGHPVVQGKLSYAVPFGSLAAGLPAQRIVDGGVAFGANLGVGISRVAVLEASGTYALLSGASGCGGCSGRSLDLGLGLVYHVAQGLAFDPWVSYGAGYRRATFTGAPSGTTALPTLQGSVFQGVDVARFALGGDFYPAPVVGLGLFVELDAGVFVARPEGFTAGSYGYGSFQAGLRIALDPLPRGARAAASAASATHRGEIGAAAPRGAPPR